MSAPTAGAGRPGPAIDFGLEREAEAQQTARDVLSRVTLCLRLAGMHQLSNAAMGPPMAQLAETVNRLLLHGPVSLAVISENFFLNRDLVRLDYSTFESAQVLQGLFRKLGIHELNFLAPLTDASLRAFLAGYQRCLAEEPGALLKARFEGISARVLNKVEQTTYGRGQLDARQGALQHYATLALVIEVAAASLAKGAPARIARLRRAVQGLAETAAGQEQVLVGLTRLPVLRGAPHHHLASVAALSLVLAARLRLPRAETSNLGLAAALHDLARADLPEPSLSAKPEGGPGGEARAALARRGPLRSLLRATGAGFSAELLTLASVAGEVGARADAPDPPSAFARLIAVPCAFDRLTNPPPPKRALAPDRALRLLLARAPTRFDPRIVRLFASVVGPYPAGTAVRLTTGELAVVVSVPQAPALAARPQVKVVRGRSGPASYLLDLGEARVASRIAECVDAVDERIDVSKALLG